ncbi:MAG: DUF805 domain-containing protein [Sphingobacteriales bacterium]|nr:MAG: DUF805 domain-containing protein [Sphingobacteriales bacterium]
MDWWKKVVFQNYANFTGRARRSEYWYYVLGQFCIIIPFYIIAIAGALNENESLSLLGFAVYGIIILGTLIPSLAVSVRRLHDVGRSGWFYFIGLIPLIGPIVLLVWFFTEGNRFANKWGEDPKNPDGPVFDFEQTQQKTNY